MKEDGGELLDEGGLEAEDVEENDVNSGRRPQRGLRRIAEDRGGCPEGPKAEKIIRGASWWINELVSMRESSRPQ